MEAGRPDRDDPELERELARRLPAPRPRADFEAELRARFAGKEAARGGSHGLYDTRTTGSSMLEDRLRKHPLAAPARPEFRAGLARRFVSGRFGSEVRTAPAPRGPSREDPRSAPRALRSGPYPWQVALGFAAAAAAVAWLVIGTRDPGGTERRDPPIVDTLRGWKVRHIGRSFAVNDQRVQTANLASLAKEIETANCVGCYEEGAELELRGELRLGLSPFSRLELPDERTLDDQALDPTCELEYALDRGAVQLERKPGCSRPLVVSTPHAKIRIVGTVLAIEVFEGKGTCICVAQGRVEVQVLSGGSQQVIVEGDQTCFVFDDARAPEHGRTGDMVGDEHAAPLREFYAR